MPLAARGRTLLLCQPKHYDSPQAGLRFSTSADAQPASPALRAKPQAGAPRSFGCTCRIARSCSEAAGGMPDPRSLCRDAHTLCSSTTTLQRTLRALGAPWGTGRLPRGTGGLLDTPPGVIGSPAPLVLRLNERFQVQPYEYMYGCAHEDSWLGCRGLGVCLCEQSWLWPFAHTCALAWLAVSGLSAVMARLQLTRACNGSIAAFLQSLICVTHAGRAAP